MGSGSKSARDPSAVAIRGMISSDVPAVLSLLRKSPEASLWSEKSLLESAAQGWAWVAEQDGTVAGFLIGRAVADEFEILNMAVARGHRRRGIGGQLVRQTLQRVRKSGARSAHLEVRASNQAAIHLYQLHGFAASGRREQYYQHPPEDALLFTMEWKSTEE